jgi:tryptophan synthase alpha chain
MSRIEQTFERLKRRRQAALIPFIMAGDPDLKTTEALAVRMAEGGADIIELGVPYSDPLADGPTIQAASQRALQNGVNLESIFSLARKLQGIASPLVLMTYFNPIFRYGLQAFVSGCQKSGIDGVIVPDLPPEEAGAWIEEARKVELDTIFLVAPTSPEERVRLVNKVSRGFIYYVSVTGVTGVRGNLPEELASAVRKIKEGSRKPVAVGFGVSTPEQAKEVSGFADGVIVGSAIVQIIEEEGKNDKLAKRVGDFIASLTVAMEP